MPSRAAAHAAAHAAAPRGTDGASILPLQPTRDETATAKSVGRRCRRITGPSGGTQSQPIGEAERVVEAILHGTVVHGDPVFQSCLEYFGIGAARA
jgi:hypothetical protein